LDYFCQYGIYYSELIKMWTSENNWYKWSYGDEPAFGRQTSDLKFQINYSSRKVNRPCLSYKNELLNAAKSTIDHYSGLRPCIFFSGGMDSELILRAYLEIGSNPEVYIVRYEKDYNIYDVSYAITICNILNVKYNIIDFNLEKFYNNDAELISEQAQIDRPRMLPHLKFTECADGLIIVGHSDIAWMRPHNDYNIKANWVLHEYEHDAGCDKYNMLHNRTAIFQWWKWTPELVLSYTKLKWFQNLTNDKYVGRLGINSTKIQGFRELYPDMIFRNKMTGFEKVDRLITDLENSLAKKYNGLPYRQCVERTLEQLTNELSNN
jgi:hypothetical protein